MPKSTWTPYITFSSQSVEWEGENSDGMVEQPTAEQTEFSISREDFPTLPGTVNQPTAEQKNITNPSKDFSPLFGTQNAESSQLAANQGVQGVHHSDGHGAVSLSYHGAASLGKTGGYHNQQHRSDHRGADSLHKTDDYHQHHSGHHGADSLSKTGVHHRYYEGHHEGGSLGRTVARHHQQHYSGHQGADNLHKMGDHNQHYSGHHGADKLSKTGVQHDYYAGHSGAASLGNMGAHHHQQQHHSGYQGTNSPRKTDDYHQYRPGHHGADSLRKTGVHHDYYAGYHGAGSLGKTGAHHHQQHHSGHQGADSLRKKRDYYQHHSGHHEAGSPRKTGTHQKQHHSGHQGADSLRKTGGIMDIKDQSSQSSVNNLNTMMDPITDAIGIGMGLHNDAGNCNVNMDEGDMNRAEQTSPNTMIANTPPSVHNKEFGMGDIAALLNAAESNPMVATLAIGPKLGSQYSYFNSPVLKDIDDNVPLKFLVNPTIMRKLSPIMLRNCQDDLLFYIFYTFVGDVKQLAVAAELHRRNWRYHTEFKVWICPVPSVGPQFRYYNSTILYRRYYYFDPQIWQRVAKEFLLDSTKLDKCPDLSAYDGMNEHL